MTPPRDEVLAAYRAFVVETEEWLDPDDMEDQPSSADIYDRLHDALDRLADLTREDQPQSEKAPRYRLATVEELRGGDVDLIHGPETAAIVVDRHHEKIGEYPVVLAVAHADDATWILDAMNASAGDAMGAGRRRTRTPGSPPR